MSVHLALCADKRPHPAHDEQARSFTLRCLGRPEPGTPAHRAWELIHEHTLDNLHGDASGLEDGVAAAVHALTAAGLLMEDASCGPPT